MHLDKNSGFTLIEIIIVVMIIGILAAIAIPMMQSNTNKAKISEAIASLGSIRSAERLYFIESNRYISVDTGQWASGPLSSYIKGTDLDGQYFPNTCYNVNNGTGSTLNIRCNMNASGKKASNTLGTVSMDQRGNITYGSGINS